MSLPSSRSIAPFVVATVLIDAIGFGIIMPVLPRVVMLLGHVDLPAATRLGGWLSLVYAAVQFLTGPTVGNLGDRFGRRVVVLGSLTGYAIDYAIMGFAPTLGWLFAGRALAGLFGAAFGPAGAALADISAPEERAKYFGMMGAAFGIGFVVGPAIGGLLGDFGPRAPFYAAATLAAVNLLVGLFVFPETLPAERRRPFSWRRANPLGALLALGKIEGLLPLAAVVFWWDLATMVYPTTWSFFVIGRYRWSSAMVGASLAVVGVLMAASQMLVVGRVVKRVGERNAAALGIGLTVFGFVLYVFASRGWMIFPILVVTAAQSLVMPSLSGLMSRNVPANAQGELQGFNGSVAAIGAIGAPLILNPALAYFTGRTAPFYFPGVAFAIAAAFGLVALALLLRRPSDRPTNPVG